MASGQCLSVSHAWRSNRYSIHGSMDHRHDNHCYLEYHLTFLWTMSFIWHFNDDVMTWKSFPHYWLLVIGDAITLMWRHFNDNTGNELMGIVIHENQISWDAFCRYLPKLILSAIFERFFDLDIFYWDVKYRRIVHLKQISTNLGACCEHRDCTIKIFQTCMIYCACYIHVMRSFNHDMI